MIMRDQRSALRSSLPCRSGKRYDIPIYIAFLELIEISYYIIESDNLSLKPKDYDAYSAMSVMDEKLESWYVKLAPGLKPLSTDAVSCPDTLLLLQ